MGDTLDDDVAEFVHGVRPRSRYRQILNGPTKSYNVQYTVDELHALELYAIENRQSKAAVVRDAVRGFVNRASGGSTPDGEHPLASVEEAFQMGVEAACDRISADTRLRVKMASGQSMGENIAECIKRDLVGS